MAEAAISDVAIANLCLQKLGAKRIESFDQNHPNARSVAAAYYRVRNRLLRGTPTWNFAIKRASVAADGTQTVWGSLNRFALPNDFLRLLRSTEDGTGYTSPRQTWKIEAGYIVTSDSAPLEFRYVYKVTDPAQFDELFVDYFATVLAFQLCEEITQSNEKKEQLRLDMKEILADAARANAIENDAEEAPEDDWLLARL